MTEYQIMTDYQADILIESLQRTFAKRRLAKNIIYQGNYESIISLDDEQLICCLAYIEQLSSGDRIELLTKIVDFFSDKELKNKNLISIFSKFRNDLVFIA
jgi:hypothetical protein